MDIDLKRVTEEINLRKSAKAERSTILGEKSPVPISGDKFLEQLTHSRNYGVKTDASVKVETVAKVTDAKGRAKARGQHVDGVAIAKELLEHAKVQPSNHNTVQKVPNNMGINENKENEKERIKELALKMERDDTRLGNGTMANAMEQYEKIQYVGSPMNNQNYQGNNLTEEKMRNNQYGQPQQPQQLGGSMIVEQVNNVAQNFLNEHFSTLFSDSLKSTIVEAYKQERVREAILENRELIKDIVVETILELQKRNQDSKK